MNLISINEYDIVNYKIPSMFLIFPHCTFKCDYECGKPICQNSALAHEPAVEIDTMKVVQKYLNNPLTHAVVCGGLEPFDSKEELFTFIALFRGFSKDPIVIYTGYTEEELKEEIFILQQFDNIIIKFGRFIPNSLHIFDAVLGVELASNNQYAKIFGRGVYNEYLGENGRENIVQEQ